LFTGAFCFAQWDAPPEEKPSAGNKKEGAPPVGGGEGGSEGGPISPSKKKQKVSGGHSQEVEEEQSDLGKRYPVDKDVVIFCKPTEDDETIPLDIDQYYTNAGNLQARVPLLAGTVMSWKLDSQCSHGHQEETGETIKLPPEFLAVEVRRNSYPVPKASIYIGLKVAYLWHICAISLISVDTASYVYLLRKSLSSTD
jgi:hypothetical protein